MPIILGVGAALISKLIESKTWTLLNIETGEAVKGQFPTEENNLTISSDWQEIGMLTRSNPILQYLGGKADTFSFTARFYKVDLLDNTPVERANTIEKWVRRDPKLGRPPRVQFALGNGEAVNMQCIIESVSDISIDTPYVDGTVRDISFSVSLVRAEDHSLSDKIEFDTRYHRASNGDTYEMIAQREYGNPLLGDLLRKQDEQIGYPLLAPGDIIKVPSIRGIRSKKIQPTSIVLSGAYSRKDTDQKARRQEVQAALSGPRNSFLSGT